ncbi:MAG: helix-turn-helix domain-containing protein [Anaeromyxobacteraceae bacterium]|nr:helix-turn-helix domain-containing protein [Anaeromyxobacteraceae bacterium]
MRNLAPAGRLLRVEVVAQHLGVHPATVYKVCKTGQLRHVRISGAIRVPEEALQAYLAGPLFQPQVGGAGEPTTREPTKESK